LHCVFHGIRFKVNEDWVSVIDTLLFFVCILIIFLLPEQKKNEAKRKFAVCIFLPTPALFSAKQKALPLYGKKKRTDLYPFSEGINLASLVIGYSLDVSTKKLMRENIHLKQ